MYLHSQFDPFWGTCWYYVPRTRYYVHGATLDAGALSTCKYIVHRYLVHGYIGTCTRFDPERKRVRFEVRGGIETLRCVAWLCCVCVCACVVVPGRPRSQDSVLLPPLPNQAATYDIAFLVYQARRNFRAVFHLIRVSIWTRTAPILTTPT